ncbi:hypothetical protein [Oscillatoria sp. HE19RPO]|uniref:hypothetical protein n=1 Tax=Oscillatoria sp. HE19RPO TaxID=2954806 RepID=UPI0020C345F4|nr:hypothetical protein [Oscillatoria sp. HE19RPO]
MPNFPYPEPPYFLLAAAFIAAVASGTAFYATLTQLVQAWSRNRSTRSLSQARGMELQLPFLGMAGAICVFLASGLQVFGFNLLISYVFSFPLTILTAWLVWSQLGNLLMQLQRGGSKALDLDSWE